MRMAFGCWLAQKGGIRESVLRSRYCSPVFNVLSLMLGNLPCHCEEQDCGPHVSSGQVLSLTEKRKRGLSRLLPNGYVLAEPVHRLRPANSISSFSSSTESRSARHSSLQGRTLPPPVSQPSHRRPLRRPSRCSAPASCCVRTRLRWSHRHP
jgi:hypothetical protein